MYMSYIIIIILYMYHSPISQVRSINPKYVTCKIAKVWHSITIFIACLVIPLLYIHVHVHSILSIEYLKVFKQEICISYPIISYRMACLSCTSTYCTWLNERYTLIRWYSTVHVLLMYCNKCEFPLLIA